MTWRYNFPAHKDVPKDDIQMARQTSKIVEEADETCAEGRVLENLSVQSNGSLAYECVLTPVKTAMMRECLDTIHACETLLRAFPPEMVAAERDQIVEKNRKRGYYRDEVAL